MSSMEMSIGVMVPIEPLDTEAEEYWDLEEVLYDETDWRINYEGTIAFTDVGGDEHELVIGDLKNEEPDYQDLILNGIVPNVELAKPYRCLWYNGVDSPMSTLTIEEFMKEVEK